MASGGLIDAQARRVGRLVGSLTWWLGHRRQDVGRWPSRLARDFPARVERLAHSFHEGAEYLPCQSAVMHGQRGAALDSALDAAGRSRVANPVRAGASAAAPRWQALPAVLWALVFLTRIFDLVGGPELAEAGLRLLTRTYRLTSGEEAAGAALLGSEAIAWPEVRIAEGGILKPIFRVNGQRAFTLWHTINLPGGGLHTREHRDILMHELVHVFQYCRLGSAYIVQALHAQLTPPGYDYGGPATLAENRASHGWRYRDYNREQQARIVQDYYVLTRRQPHDDEERRQVADAVACLKPCIAEMQAGEF